MNDACPKVAIIILNWNGWRDTIECLNSLQRLTYPNYHIMVVDNGSTDDSVDKITAWAIAHALRVYRFYTAKTSKKSMPTVDVQVNQTLNHTVSSELPPPQLTLIAAKDNYGFAGGVNIALRCMLEQDYDYAWLLNNDTIVDSEALTELVKVAEADRRIGMVGSKILFYDRPDLIQEAGVNGILPLGLFFMRGHGAPDKGQYDQSTFVSFVSGCSLLVRMSLVRDVGLLDETYYMYCEESDWQVRATRHGWMLAYAHKSKVWHKLGKSSGGQGSSFHAYFTTRNALLLVGRYCRHTLPIAVAVHLGRVGKKVLGRKFAEAAGMARGLWDGVLLALKGAGRGEAGRL